MAQKQHASANDLSFDTYSFTFLYFIYPLRYFRIIELNGGQPPLTYKRFQTLISRMDPPEMPVETLSNTSMGCCVTPVSEDHGDKYGVPSLEELGELIEMKSFICQVSGEFQFS